MNHENIYSKKMQRKAKKNKKQNKQRTIKIHAKQSNHTGV